MSKPALGRSLGSLLPSHDASTAAPSTPPKVTPGVATLISGHRPSESAKASPAQTSASPETLAAGAHWTRLRWMLVTADLLLCGMAAALMLRQTAPVRPEEAVLCVAAILLGAWLGCSAWSMGRQRPQ